MSGKRDYYRMVVEGSTRRLRGNVSEEIRGAVLKAAGALEHRLDEWEKTVADIEADDGLSPAGKARARAQKAQEARAALQAAIDGHGWRDTIKTLKAELSKPSGAQSELAQVLSEMRASELRRELQRQSGNDPLVAFGLLQDDAELLEAMSRAPKFIQRAMLPTEGVSLIERHQEAARRARDPGRALLLDQVTAAQAAYDAIAQAALSAFEQSEPPADPLAAVAGTDGAAVAAI